MLRWMTALALMTTNAYAADFPVVSFPIDKSGVTFTTPSGNIECHFTPRGGTEIYTTRDNLAELQCDRAAPVYFRFVMSERGPAELVKNPGEQPCCSADNPLPYGRAWEMSPFRCESAETGLTCERKDGRGFFINRASPRIF